METNSPEVIAKELIDNGCTIEQYELVQSRRIERLAFWKEKNLTELISKEEKLIALGEEVLKSMKQWK